MLSDNLGVTIGTISRAYGELERLGLVVARVGDGTFVRKRGMERQRDEGFRNFSEEPRQYFDMSRNMHIPGQETVFRPELPNPVDQRQVPPGHQRLHPRRRPAALP